MDDDRIQVEAVKDGDKMVAVIIQNRRFQVKLVHEQVFLTAEFFPDGDLGQKGRLNSTRQHLIGFILQVPGLFP
jgi:hypothetical protein